VCSVEVFAYDKKCRPQKSGASEGVKVQSKNLYVIPTGKTVGIDLGFVVKYGEATYIIVEVEIEGLRPQKHVLESGDNAVLNVVNVSEEVVKIQAYDTVGIMFIVEPVQVLDLQV